MDMRNRVALITGGAGHIGSVMAEALAEAGASVVLLDVDEAHARKKAFDIQQKYGVKVESLRIDIGQDDQVRSVPKMVLDRLGRLDILINCAALVGTSHLKGWAVPFKEQDIDTWRKALEVNLTSGFLLTQSCRDALRKDGHGSVINIGSIYGMVGPDLRLYEKTSMGSPAAYAASKGGLLQLTRWLATVLAPEIRVNMISIGGVFRNHEEPFLNRYQARTPLKRMATEEDLKGAALYLASDLSSYVTGHNLVVDGGWTVW